MLMPVIDLWLPMEQCKQACIAVEGCIYFNFSHEKQRCWLSTSKGLGQHLGYRPDETYNYQGYTIYIVIYTDEQIG